MLQPQAIGGRGEARSLDPVDLWNYLAGYEQQTGGEVIAIAHNGNLVNAGELREAIAADIPEVEFTSTTDSELIAFAIQHAVNQGLGWDPAIREAATRARAFSFGAQSLDAALLLFLEPGAYTAVVGPPASAPAAQQTGLALVEIYDASP